MPGHTDDGPGDDQADDAHLSALDVRSVLSDVSLVVASNRERCVTAATAPDWLDAVVRTDEGRNRARNRGVAAAANDWLVVADDDITFPATLTAMLVDAMHERHLVGLEDVWPMEWVLTRYAVFHRSLFDAVGGFDERREHGGDTDFAIRAEKRGARVLRLPRHVVPHHDEESAFTLGEHLEWLAYLLRRHPLRMAPKAWWLALAKVGLVDPGRRDYPADWTGALWSRDPPGGGPA